MKPLHLVIISFVCIVAAVAVPVSAGPADVMVTTSTIDPPTLMKGDTGTLTVEIKNNGADSVFIRSARLYGSGVVGLSDSYLAVGDLGAGNSKTFTFTVQADAGEGTFYPVFVLEFQDGGNLRHPVPVQVEDTPLSVAVVKKPDAFAEGRTADISVRVANPRPNSVSGVQVIPQGAGFTVTPTGAFIGGLSADESGTVLFNLTPEAETNVTFQVVWRNGINTHTADLSLPILFGVDKRQADPLASNIEVIPEAGSGGYRVVGDVMNAGLEPARSVRVTPGAPAIPTDPFRVYVVGTLDPDDAAPFEVTFKVGAAVTEVPIVIEYRDDDGNRYSTTTTVEVSGGAMAPVQEQDSGIPLGGVIVAVLIAIGVIGAIYYSWRRT
jgi:hypothetical protein